MSAGGKGGVPLLDPVAQYRRIAADVDARVRAVLAHGRFVHGPEVAEFEAALAGLTGAPEAVAVASGTDALVIALRGEGVGPGDAVFVPAFTFLSTAGAAALAGAAPVFVDVDPRTFAIDPDDLAERIRAVRREGGLRPRAVIAVDLFGLPADYDRLEPLCREEGLFLLADAAQSLGARRGGRGVGTMGDAAATSFFPSKPLGAYGDGGALLTADPGRARLWRSLRNHGTGDDPYDGLRIGTNSRLDTLQAAVLLAKLPHFPEEVRRRNEIARAYGEGLRDVAVTPEVPAGAESVWAQYSVLVDGRDRIRAGLEEAGIPSRVYYPIPVPRQKAFRGFAGGGAWPEADRLAARILSLPLHPELRDEDCARVVEAFRKAAGRGS